jgi:hypothetical protein
MLSWIERTIKTKIEEKELPKVAELIEIKKKRLIANTKEILQKDLDISYVDLAEQLLEL